MNTWINQASHSRMTWNAVVRQPSLDVQTATIQAMSLQSGCVQLGNAKSLHAHGMRSSDVVGWTAWVAITAQPCCETDL